MKKVKYIGDIDFFNGIYDVIVIIHDGEPIGNGEINLSGENIYRCKREGDTYSACWLFREDEIEHITE